MKQIALSLIALFMAGCSFNLGANGQPGQPGKPGTSGTGYEILKQDQYGGREMPENIVIRNQIELEKLYKELNLDAAPKVDFTAKSVVALFMGQKNNGGYTIGIESVVYDDTIATVTIRRTFPDGIATMALTQPYFIAAIATKKPVLFK